MTLFDCECDSGRISAIGGDAETHRRLVDMGLLGAAFTVKARRKSAMLVDFGAFSAVVGEALSKRISVVENKS